VAQIGLSTIVRSYDSCRLCVTVTWLALTQKCSLVRFVHSAQSDARQLLERAYGRPDVSGAAPANAHQRSPGCWGGPPFFEGMPWR
jgi:hypothetical protein